MNMKRLVVMAVAAGAAVAAVAMPTKQELQKAQAMVRDVTASDLKKLRAKTKTFGEVAVRYMQLASQSGNEAEKYLLLQGAFKLYAKSGDYEGAANALVTMNREIADMNPEVIVEIYNKAIFSSMKEKAPKLYAVKEAARRQVFYRKQLAKSEAAVKADPKDAAAQKQLGECYAELGDWPKALNAFALAGGALAKTAKSELDGSAAPQVFGDFWWDYMSGDEISTYKLHAAGLYRAALAYISSFKGLARARAEQRVKEAELEIAQHVAESAEQRAQHRAIQDELARLRGERVAAAATAAKDSSLGVQKAIESILKGMIKVPGRDYWLSATELTQEQWEPVMECNLSEHKGAKLPVEMVSRDDCDVFLERLNQTKEVRESQFEFCLPTESEWLYAAQGGSGRADVCCIKPGVAGNVLDMAWVMENSSNQTHEVATKSANAFGFYDMQGNVWEWLANEQVSRGCRRGGAFNVDIGGCSVHRVIHTPRGRRYGICGLRLAAHKRVRPLLGGLKRPGASDGGLLGGSLRDHRLPRQQEAQATTDQRQETVDGYTWSYRVKNGEAEIVAEKDGKFSCAVSPNLTGEVKIPSTLGGVKVTRIGERAFRGLGMASVLIPASVTSIGVAPFAWCGGLTRIDVAAGNHGFVSVGGVLCTKDLKELVMCPPGLTTVTVPESVTTIREGAFHGCNRLVALTIPSAVKNIKTWAFSGCRGLTSVAIPASVTNIDDGVFWNCSGLTTVTMRGECPTAKNDIFKGCRNLKAIHVPANCKSWAGMKEWQGIPLVFDRGQ